MVSDKSKKNVAVPGVCACVSMRIASTQLGSQSTWQGLEGTPAHIAASNLAKTKEKLFIRNVLPNEQREALKTTHSDASERKRGVIQSVFRCVPLR